MLRAAKLRISLIVATAKNGIIGSNNQMPWHLPADFAYFKRITLGHPVIMGRKTFEAIGRALPGRRNIVVSRNPYFRADGAEVATSLEAAISACQLPHASEEIFVIGGATLYAQALSRADRLYITEVDATPEGDTLFPSRDPNLWREIARERQEADARNVYAMQFVVFERK